MYNNIYLKNSDDTMKIGEIIGIILKEGSFVCIHGDLGAGKTHMAKGIAKGIGIDEAISSPTFTIVQEYRGENIDLLHFDAYRLSNSEELECIGFNDYLKRKAVIVMEWAEIVEDIIPRKRIDIFLRYSVDGSRNMDIIVNDDSLIEEFKNLNL